MAKTQLDPNDPWAKIGAVPDDDDDSQPVQSNSRALDPNDPWAKIGAIPDDDYEPVKTTPYLVQNAKDVYNDTKKALYNNALSALLGATHLGGNLIGDTGSIIKPVFSKAGQNLQNLGQQGANTTFHDFGIDNPTLTNQLIAGISPTIPYALATPERLGLSAISKLAPYIKGGLQGALYGSTQSDPDHLLSGTAINAGLGGALGATPQIYSGLKKVIGVPKKIKDFLNNEPVKQEATNLIQQLSNNLPKEDLKSLNFNKLNSIKNNLNNSISDQYSSLFNDASKRGYGIENNKMDLSADTGINYSPVTQDSLEKILNDSSSSSGLKKSINEFNSKNSFENADKLRSNLASEASKIGSYNSPANLNISKFLNDTRQNLYNDIADTFDYNNSIGTEYGSKIGDKLIKGINSSPDTQKSLDKILNDPSSSSNLKKAINKFSSTKSFENAHNLQSTLGADSARIGSYNSKINYNLSKFLSDTRQNLNNDIADTLVKNGDMDLMGRYKNIGNLYKNNIVPYNIISRLRNTPKGKSDIPNIINILKGYDPPEVTYRDTIRNHLLGRVNVGDVGATNEAQQLKNSLLQNPINTNSIDAQILHNNSLKLGSNNAYSVDDPNSLLEKYNNLPLSLKKLLNPETSSRLDNLNVANDKYNKYMKFLSLKDAKKSFTQGLGIMTPLIIADNYLTK